MNKTVNGNDKKEVVRCFIDQLKTYRGTTPNPEQLEWEIRVYEFILQDIDVRYKAYMETRMSGHLVLTKRQVVEKLGWDVK